MTDPASKILDFKVNSNEPTLLDILRRDLNRAIDAQSVAEGQVNTAKLHIEQANAEYTNSYALLEGKAKEVQRLKKIIQLHELDELKPTV